LPFGAKHRVARHHTLVAAFAFTPLTRLRGLYAFMPVGFAAFSPDGFDLGCHMATAATDATIYVCIHVDVT
jgi:hypothetical protein